MNSINSLAFAKNLTIQFVRGYAFKSDLKIKWVRPEKIPCISPLKSGDQSKLPAIAPDTIMLNFQKSTELQNADDVVKSRFTIENNKRRQVYYIHRRSLIESVQRHSLDFGSMEATLARMTAKIRHQQELLEQFPRQVKVKVHCKELIDKRKKYLKYLRRWDYRRFEWILEKLDLVYKPPPSEFHWITRKDSLRKLTNTHCENLRQQKLDEYQKHLEAQQIPFLEKKLKNLQFIRKEQQECKVPITVSEEDISVIRKQLEKLKLQRDELNVAEN